MGGAATEIGPRLDGRARRGGELRPRLDRAHRPASQAAERGLAAVRARRRPRGRRPRCGARRAAARRARRRHRRTRSARCSTTRCRRSRSTCRAAMSSPSSASRSRARRSSRRSPTSVPRSPPAATAGRSRRRAGVPTSPTRRRSPRRSPASSATTASPRCCRSLRPGAVFRVPSACAASRASVSPRRGSPRCCPTRSSRAPRTTSSAGRWQAVCRRSSSPTRSTRMPRACAPRSSPVSSPSRTATSRAD